MTDHFDESIMNGTLLMSGSDAMRLTNRVIAAAESSIASSMLMSTIWAPGIDLLAGDLDGLLELIVEDQLGELARTGDVRPLADVDEDVAGLRDLERLEPGEAGLDLDLGRDARRQPGDGLGDRADVGRASSRSSRRRC